MRFMAQFDITSDVSVTDDAAKFSIHSSDDEFSLVIRDVTLVDDERLARFRCNMEFESENLQNAKEDFLDRVLGVLDIMSLISHAEFTFDRLHKIFDWTSNITMRDGLIFVYGAPKPKPDYVLDHEFFEVANLFQSAVLDDRLRSALRWFRLGIAADTVEEQFKNLWFALELLALHRREVGKIHDACPTCGEPLYCKVCDSHPMHRPYPIQAIESIWKETAPDELESFQIMNKTRHKLLHGVPANRIEAISGVPLHKMIDPLAQLTWRGLFAAIVAALPEDERPQSLKVSIANTFVKWDVTAAVSITAEVPLGTNGTADIELLEGISAEFVDG